MNCDFQSFSFSREETTVKLIPSASLPDELKNPDTLDYLSSLINVESTGFSAGNEAEGQISLTTTLVDEMLRYYLTYGRTLLFTLKVNLVYIGNDGKTRLEVPYETFLEFSDFIFNTNDLCSVGELWKVFWL